MDAALKFETQAVSSEVEENQKLVRKMVLDSFDDMKAGKGRKAEEFFAELEKGMRMNQYEVITLPLAEEDMVVYVLRVLHMRVDAKPLLLNII